MAPPPTGKMPIVLMCGFATADKSVLEWIKIMIMKIDFEMHPTRVAAFAVAVARLPKVAMEASQLTTIFMNELMSIGSKVIVVP